MTDTIEKILRYYNADVCCVIRSKLTPREKGKQFKLKTNSDYSGTIWRFHVDGCLDKSQISKKCDYTFYLESSDFHYFVELKGGDVRTAISQLNSTIQSYHSALEIRKKDMKLTACAVTSSIPKENSTVRKARDYFMRNYGADFKTKTNVMELVVD